MVDDAAGAPPAEPPGYFACNSSTETGSPTESISHQLGYRGEAPETE